jgi:predicted short-subunit dehydrogenase-like oxidoreductase (DUF2520 family)
MEGTLSNLKVMAPKSALTGPIARGDIGTVSRHIEALEEKLPEMLDLYQTLGQKTLKLAEEKGKLDPEKLRAINELLKK